MELTEQKLQTILEAVDKPLAEDLFNNFHMRNPLDFAKLLVALDISDSIKSQLLACKVSAKQPYQGENLEILIERAAQLMWARLGAE